jgi:hypothetical protein
MERLLLRWRAGRYGLLKFRAGDWQWPGMKVRFRNNFRNDTEEQPNLAALLVLAFQQLPTSSCRKQIWVTRHSRDPERPLKSPAFRLRTAYGRMRGAEPQKIP